MTFRLLLPAALAVLVCGAPGFAAGRTVHHRAPVARFRHDERDHLATSPIPAARCAALERRLTAALKTHDGAARAEDAKMLRTDGYSFCATGQYAAGIKRLEQGLVALGVAARG